MTPFDLDSFEWNKEDRIFTSEWSQLTRVPGNIGDFCFSSPGAVAFSIVNPKTGNVSDWTFIESEYDSEGELLWDTFAPTTPSLTQFPALKGIRVVIYND